MNNILTIAKKELKVYLASPLAYVFGFSLLSISLWIFLSTFFVNNQSSLDPLWNLVIFLFSLFIPAISMSSIAEEKKSGTWELLLSLPISELEITIGKFLSLFSFVLIIIGLYLPMAITLIVIGQPDIGALIGGFLSIIFLSASYLSCGIFASSLSDQPVTSFLISLIFLLINSLLSQNTFLSYFPSFLKGAISFLSLSWHAQHLAQGFISLSDISFFISWLVVFLIFTLLSLKSRHR